MSSTKTTLLEMLELAQQTEKDLQSVEKSRSLYSDAIAKAKVDAEDAETSLDKAKSAMDAWKSEWATEMQRIGLEPNALPNQANEVLNSIKELFQKLHDADGFRKRNLGIDRDAKRFVADVQQIALEVSPDLTSLPTEELILRLTTELETARKSEAIRNQLEHQRKSAATNLQAAEQSYLEVSQQVGELCRLAGCSKHEDLQRAAELSRQRRDVVGKIEILEDQILKNAGSKSLEDFLVEVELEAVNPDSLAPRIDQLDRDIRQLHDSRDEAVTMPKKLWNKELIIAELKRCRQNGPKFNAHLDDAARRHFGSLRAALDAAGLPCAKKPPPYNVWSKQSVIEAIRKRHRDGASLERVCRDDRLLYSAGKRLFGNWSAALAAAGYPRPMREFYTADEVRLMIIDLYESGVALSLKSQNDQKLQRSTKKHFGGWRRAVESLGLGSELPRMWTDQSVIDAILHRRASGKSIYTTREEDSGLFGAAVNRFGTWHNALQAAGIDGRVRE